VGELTGAGGTARLGTTTHSTQDNEPSSGQHLMPGQQVVLKGRNYRVETTLSATTSEARTYVVVEDGNRYVLKVYRPGVYAPLAALAAIQSQPHANVVAIHDQGYEAGQHFEVLEYFPAGTLDQLLRRQGPLRDLALLRLLASQIADGLQHLHERVGLIYQDLKPENVLISGPDLKRVVLADFGISTLRQGMGDVQVTANGTREYAAPELARFGNETKTLVSEKVDYFALGITLLECWQGTRPFQGIPDGLRVAQIREREVPFPSDIDASLETLIKGLISPSVKERFGLTQVRRWVSGLPLQVDYTPTHRVYERLVFRGDETYETPSQLSALLEKYRDQGIDYLYEGTIGKWLEAARDMELGTQIAKIVRQFDQDDASRRAGLVRAIYTLDTQRTFVTAGGRSCASEEQMGDALLAERDHYVNALNNPFDPFYLYLHARGEGEFATEMLARFVGSQSAASAFNQLVFSLHSEGRIRIKLAGHEYLHPEELANAPLDVHQELKQGLLEPGSRVLLWLQKLGVVERLDELRKARPIDQLGVTQAMPWLRLADLVPEIHEKAFEIFMDILRAHRMDLMDEFVRQGLDFNNPGRSEKPVVVAAGWGRLDEVRYMLDHGASIDVLHNEKHSALYAAVHNRHQAIVELLLERDAKLDASFANGQTCLGLALRHIKTNQGEYPVDPSIVERLLSAGADPNASAENGWTPLQFAVICDPPELACQLVGMLVSAGADVNKPNKDGALPLHIALAERPLQQVMPVVEELLARGADPLLDGYNSTLKDGSACNALFMALYCYHFKHKHSADYLPVIGRLVKTRVRLDTLNHGKAPLHWAAMWGDEALVRLLLSHGASKLQVGDAYMLPGTYARMGKFDGLAAQLAPGIGLMVRGRIRQAGAALFRALALLVLLLPLIPIRHWGLDNLESSAGKDSLSLGLMYGHLLVTALGLRAILVGDYRALMSRLKASLGRLMGWINWLVVAPLALAILGAGADAILAQFLVSQDYELLHSSRWSIFALAVGLCFASVWFSQRVYDFRAPYIKYQKAKTNPAPVPEAPGHAFSTIVLAVVWLWLFAEVFPERFVSGTPQEQGVSISEHSTERIENQAGAEVTRGRNAEAGRPASSNTTRNPIVSVPKSRMSTADRILEPVATDDVALPMEHKEPTGKSVVLDPRPISQPQPPYPREALRAGTSGRVVVRYTIGADGRVINVEIVSSQPRGLFDRSVSRTVKRWLFEAPGAPVTQTETFDFQM
jgi:TonB family protein